MPSSWTPDGKDLLFTRGFTSLGGNTDIYAASIGQPDKSRAVVDNSGDRSSAGVGKPTMLFRQGALGGGTTVRANYDVSPDGRFLMNGPIPEAADERSGKLAPSSLRFVLNWSEEVQRLLATK